ncbi:MAG: glycosyltransferase family 39 protein, partial [Caldilineaceae bacterium]|nr:glycosyltransferase family 39 protein [Caldilineaceae bacterium]
MNHAQYKRFTTIFFVLFILIAFALRVYRLDMQSLWYDEGVTATLTQRNLVDLTVWTARDIQPPLYYYVVAGWGRLAGWSEWSLRFVSAWWGVLTVPLMAVLTQKLIGNRTAAQVAALLTALHPLLVYYSQEARM